MLEAEVAGERAAVIVALPARDRVEIELEVEPGAVPPRAEWPTASDEHLTGLGARHGEPFDQAGRLVHLGADRRYTGPDCPPEMLDQGGIPQGDYVPVPWVNSQRRLGGVDRDLRRGPRARPARADRGLPARRRRGRSACGCSATRRRPPACATTCG